MSDPEIAAMLTFIQALEPLDEATRDRVLRWARERYGKASSAKELAGPTIPNRVDILPREQASYADTDLPGTYAAANPTSDGEKVLVVGYWFQIVRGESELDSMTLNSELKNLGYPVGNITRAVNTLTTSSPRYLVQTKKTGSSQQARKKFRLTVEGIKRVEQMLGAAIPARLLPSSDAASGSADGS